MPKQRITEGDAASIARVLDNLNDAYRSNNLMFEGTATIGDKPFRVEMSDDEHVVVVGEQDEPATRRVRQGYEPPQNTLQDVVPQQSTKLPLYELGSSSVEELVAYVMSAVPGLNTIMSGALRAHVRRAIDTVAKQSYEAGETAATNRPVNIDGLVDAAVNVVEDGEMLPGDEDNRETERIELAKAMREALSGALR